MKKLIIAIITILSLTSCVTERIVTDCNCTHNRTYNSWGYNSWNNNFWWRDPIILWNGPLFYKHHRPETPNNRRSPVPMDPPRRYTPQQRERIVTPNNDGVRRPSSPPSRDNVYRSNPSRVQPSEPRQVRPSYSTPSRRGSNN